MNAAVEKSVSNLPNILAIVVIAKDEGRYIEEWLLFHFSNGVDKVYLYDNQSSDDTVEIANKFQNVFVTSWSTSEGESPQFSAFNHALKSYGSSCDWMLFIDVDEFLMNRSSQVSFKDYLSVVDKNVGAVAINQIVYGSSGLKEYQDIPVMQRFTKRSELCYLENRWYKTVCRPMAVETIQDAHRFSLKEGYFYVDSSFDKNNFDSKELRNTLIPSNDVWAINHYMLKSWEEFQWKKQRGGVAAHTRELRLARMSDDYFRYRDINVNTVEDDSGRLLSLKILK